MNHQIYSDPDFIKLQFSYLWIDVGIITFENFSKIKQKYFEGEDKNTGHCRWGAFNSFITTNSFISEEKFQMLYEIGKNDPDYAMGRSIIFDLVKRQDCPEALIDLAAADSDYTLAKHGLKYKKLKANTDRLF